MIRWLREPAEGDPQGGIVCGYIAIDAALIRWQSNTSQSTLFYCGELSSLLRVKQGLLIFISPKEGDVLMGPNEMKGPKGRSYVISEYPRPTC